nr:hypothetical protein [Tanacetum cinerariifolium]GEY51838.1 hypothetical protein [Tanacetum cinerariifolium]GEY53856.1 hypothetical protein [Tanacetum cinerariifolium]
MEPANTLLMGDEDASTNPARETNKFIKSIVDDFVPILKESEMTSDSNLEFDMHVNTPLPTTDVREEKFDINSPLGEHVVDFLMENEDIAYLPRHLVKQIFSYLIRHPSSTKRISDEPLDGDILFLEHLLIEETFSDPTPAMLPKKSTLLVTPPPASKQFSLREVERFDPFSSLA